MRICIGRTLAVFGSLLLTCSVTHADFACGKRIYRGNCTLCHGESGKGDGVGAQSLLVHPADHTNGVVTNSCTNAFLREVIAKGGGAMGLSSFMPAWKGIFKDHQIQDLVDYIRTLLRPRN